MGAIFVNDENGNHVSTGKYPYPAGQVHTPEWGEPYHYDMGVMAQDCEFGMGACDLFQVVQR
jgi:hypothetical protein